MLFHSWKKKRPASAFRTFVVCCAVLFLHVWTTSAFAADGTASRTGPPAKIAVFDFENFSNDGTVINDLMPLVRQWLVTHGYEVVDEKLLAQFLIKERVRSTAYVSTRLVAKMKQALGVEAVLVGAVHEFSTDGMPRIGMSARLIGGSRDNIVWAGFASAAGDDFSRILGLGTLWEMSQLAPRVVDMMMKTFSTVPFQREIESTYRVAVMPFLNKSGKRDVGMLATTLFLVSLSRSAVFVPVEFGDVRESMVRSLIRSRGQLDYKDIAAVAAMLNVDAILVGTVDSYSDGMQNNAPPQVTVTGRLIDARKKRILWYESMYLGGDDRVKILDFGRIRTVDKVAYTAIEKLTRDMEKTKWQ